MNRGVINKVADSVRFLRVSISKFEQSASLLPSSRWMVQAMAEAGPIREAKTIVELGSGMGTITAGLLERARPDAKLFGVEIDADLVAASTKRFTDPRVKFLCGSAENAGDLVREAGGEVPVDMAVSSVGLSMLPENIRRGIVEEAVRIVRPGGTLVHGGYLHAKYMIYSRDKGVTRYDVEPLLREYWHDVRTSIVWLNMLPIKVYVCRAHRSR